MGAISQVDELAMSEGLDDVAKLQKDVNVAWKACERWHLTLLDLEAIVVNKLLGSHELYAKEEWCSLSGKRTTRCNVSFAQSIDIHSRDLHFKSANYVELLDGTVAVR